MTDDDDRFNLYAPSDQDIIIDGCRLIMTCSVCPEQYEVFDENTRDQIGYLRLRHGWFRADAPKCGGETVYEAYPIGDGCFDNDDERIEYLTKAVRAIQEHRRQHTEENHG
jgi:hypothetical protein